MTANKKIIRNIIIAAVALGILTAGYLFALKWQPAEENGESGDVSAIRLISAEIGDIAKISFKNENGAFSIASEGDDDKSVWAIPEKRGTEFSQTMLESTVTALSGLYAEREIADNASDISEYGLSAPSAEVVVSFKDGSEETLLLGDKIITGSGYYLMKRGDTKIYSVSEYKGEQFFKQPNDFREKTLGSIDISSMKSFSVSRGGEKIFEIVNTDGDDEISNTTMSSLRITYPYSDAVDTDAFSKITEAFGSVVVEDFTDDNPSDLAKYGLNGGYVIEIEDETAKHKITLGDRDGDGNVYTMYNDKGFVFTSDSAMLDSVADVKPFDLVEKFAHIYNIENVDSVTVKSGDKTYVLSMTRSGSGDDVKVDYKINGKETTEDAFKGMYQTIIGLSATGEASSSAGGEKVCEVIFKMTDGKLNTASYYAYDERNYRVVKPDGRSYLVMKKYVTGMTDELEEFVKNPK